MRLRPPAETAVSAAHRGLVRRLSDPLIGPGASASELALGWGAATAAALVQLVWALAASHWSVLQIVVAVVFAFDIGGGVVVNATRSGRRWWHRDGQGPRRQLVFFAAHVHPFVVALLWPEFGWWQAAGLYLTMLAAVAVVMVSPARLKRPVAYGLGSAGIVLGVTVFLGPPGLVWLPPLYFVKLVMAHAVPDE